MVSDKKGGSAAGQGQVVRTGVTMIRRGDWQRQGQVVRTGLTNASHAMNVGILQVAIQRKTVVHSSHEPAAEPCAMGRARGGEGQERGVGEGQERRVGEG